jgi:Uma2 family endonuclease
MSTVMKLGPGDHGRPMTLEEFYSGDYQEGYWYEIIDGKLYVSPLPNMPQGLLELWLYKKLDRYSDDHLEVINLVYNKTRVEVHGRPGATIPEPDIAAYHDFPLNEPLGEVQWEEVSPILVAEILSADDPDKDLVRNVELYFEVPSIKEYWIFDNRANPDQPAMTMRRRHGKRWVVRHYGFGETYTTRLLPGFELIIDPRR